MAAPEKEPLREIAQKAQKAPSAHPFCAFCAISLRGSFSQSQPPRGVTVDDVVVGFFGGRIIAAVEPIPAGHQAVLEAARAAGFPWLRLRPGFAIAGDEDGWRAWLEDWVSPADLVLVRRRLAEPPWWPTSGLVSRATRGDVPARPGPAWRAQLSEEFTSSTAQTCRRCGGRRWRRTVSGDVCAACSTESEG